MPERSPFARLALLLGITLVVAGVLLTAAQFIGFRVATLGWPLLVIVPGLLVTAAAFSPPTGRGLGFLAIPGSLIVVTGLVLQAQAITGDWQSWSYAWPLVLPGAVGLGMLLAGAREKKRGVRVVGAALLAAGALLFVAAEWFFVRILGVGGPGLGWAFGLVLPTLLVALGIVVIARGALRAR